MSAFARLSLANRAVIALAAVITVVAGLWSTVALKQELIPAMDFPMAGVVTIVPGASPDVIEREVTAPIEVAVGAVGGVVGTTSTSSSNMSVITVELEYGTDMQRAQQNLQQALTRLSSSLPSDADPRVIIGSIDDFPVVQLAAAANGDTAALVEALRSDVVPLLEGVSGVREVTLTGIQDDVVLIEIDHAALAGAGLSMTSILDALQQNGVVMPVGTLPENGKTLSVEVGQRLESVDEIAALPLTPAPAMPGAPGANAPSAPGPVVLSDVATVSLQAEAPSSISRTNGKASFGIGITKTQSGNTVDISHAIRDLLPELESWLGDGGQINVIFDQAPFIEQSVEDLTTEGLLGLVFAVLVIFGFLLSVRPTLITAVSIPMSILVTMIGLHAGGHTLNILTLGALTVAVGRVVDDSIVVVENIERHMRVDVTSKRVTITAAVKEVAGAITASTIATVAVFLPVAIVGGQVGELFRPFAVTVTIALLASLLVSLTIVPVLASWFLKANTDAEELATLAGTPAQTAEVKAPASKPDRLQRAYLPTLRATLAHPVITLGTAAVLLAGTFGLASKIETEFIGDPGQNTLTVTQTLPAGTSLSVADEAVKKVEAIVAQLPDVETYQVSISGSGGLEAFLGGGGASRATVAITTKLDADTPAIEAELRDKLAELTDAGDILISADASGFGSLGVEVVVRATDTDTLREAAAIVADMVRDTPGTTDVANNFADTVPTVQVRVDRAAASKAGTSELQIAQTVATVINGVPAGEVSLDARTVAVKISTGGAPTSVEELRNLPIATATGLVPLAQVATVETVDQPTSISRINGHRSAKVTATPTEQNLGALTADLTQRIEGLQLPAGASAELGGISADQEKAFADLGMALLAAVAIVYLVMVATFRSLMQPLILLVSVPFAATGALGLLLVTGTPLGVASLIGMLMLVGIVVTNAIVLIDLINQYRQSGLGITDAIVEGARHRLRPILMTALATIGALLPMAFGVTGGSVFISQPLAIVVIGGLISSTALTLVLVPVLYYLLERARQRRADKRAQGARRPAVAAAQPAATEG